MEVIREHGPSNTLSRFPMDSQRLKQPTEGLPESALGPPLICYGCQLGVQPLDEGFSLPYCTCFVLFGCHFYEVCCFLKRKYGWGDSLL